MASSAATSYESTNLKRVLTGIPFGLGLGVLMCSMFSARAEAFVGAGRPITWQCLVLIGSQEPIKNWFTRRFKRPPRQSLAVLGMGNHRPLVRMANLWLMS